MDFVAGAKDCTTFFISLLSGGKPAGGVPGGLEVVEGARGAGFEADLSPFYARRRRRSLSACVESVFIVAVFSSREWNGDVSAVVSFIDLVGNKVFSVKSYNFGLAFLPKKSSPPW